MENSPIIDNLSDRELDVLELLATGATNKEIATKLSISLNTVKVHLRNIYTKTGSSSRTEAAMQAMRYGLIPTPDTGAAPDAGLAKGRAVPPSSLWDMIYRFRWILAGLLGVSLLITSLLLYVSLQNPPVTEQNGVNVIPATEPPRWQDRASLPSPRRGLAVAAFDGRIYAIGGESSDGITGIVERYDPTTDSWSSGSPKPLPVVDVAAAVIGGRIFVPGGRQTENQISDSLEIYDPREDLWETGAPIPTALSAYAMASFEGRIYLFGGWNGSEYVNTVYMYAPDRNEWLTLDSLPEAIGFAAAAQVGESIYVIGGRTATGPSANNLEFQPNRVDSGDPIFVARAPMPDARYAMGAASVADISIHILGGEGEASNLSALKYFPETDVWEPFELPTSGDWSHLGAVAVGSDIYGLGGVSGGTFLTRHMAYKAVYTVAIPIFNR